MLSNINRGATDALVQRHPRVPAQEPPSPARVAKQKVRLARGRARAAAIGPEADPPIQNRHAPPGQFTHSDGLALSEMDDATLNPGAFDGGPKRLGGVGDKREVAPGRQIPQLQGFLPRKNLRKDRREKRARIGVARRC